MSQFETGYQPLCSGAQFDEEEETETDEPAQNIIHHVPDSSKERWNHIENLDEFFTRVYQYHQRSGFLCMIVQDVLQIMQFLFVVCFSAFLWKCVDYDILFYEKHYNGTHKVTIHEAVYSFKTCSARFDGFIIICLLLAFLFLLLRMIKLIYNCFQYVEMRSFYAQALKINSSDLPNLTWHEVQQKLVEVQQEQQMCIHKKDLNHLDIYHRILRFKNYLIAMVNKNLLPLRYRMPFVGESVIMTTGLKYNLEMILFWGPWAPFENNWHLKSHFKNHQKRYDLATFLANRILWIGLANLLFMPVIFLWQILYSFFRYTEILKNEPNILGARRWSLYSRLYLRHFNELDHEFDARLARGYKPAERFMNIFTSPLLVIIAKHLAFFSGSILAVFIILTIIDEDFLQVEHVIAIMTILGLIATICKACIPEEHLIFCPEMLLRGILAQVHYMPDEWKGNAHRSFVREEFANLYQYKVVYLIEELLSPIITPFYLIFSLRLKALDIVDFYRNFTVEVQGVGDVCSFAQMDIRKHGHPEWTEEDATEANHYQQAEDGKTELSLVHFTLTNPGWKPPKAGAEFINNLKEKVELNATPYSLGQLDNPLISSLNSSGAGMGIAQMYTSMRASMMPPPGGLTKMPGNMSGEDVDSSQISGTLPSLQQPPAYVIRGGLRSSEGPVSAPKQGLLHSAQEAMNNSIMDLQMSQMQASGASGLLPIQQMSLLTSPMGLPARMPMSRWDSRSVIDEDNLELRSTEMAFSALYMHDLHQRRKQAGYSDTAMADLQARMLWRTPSHQDSVYTPGSINDSQTSDNRFRSSAAQHNLILPVSQPHPRLSPQREEDEENDNAGLPSPASTQLPPLEAAPFDIEAPLQSGHQSDQYQSSMYASSQAEQASRSEPMFQIESYSQSPPQSFQNNTPHENPESHSSNC